MEHTHIYGFMACRGLHHFYGSVPFLGLRAPIHSQPMRFRETLKAELGTRRSDQPGYSIRRFARVLGVHHTTASRLLQGSGPVPGRCVRALGEKLGLDADTLERTCAIERDEAVLVAIARPRFRPSTRWIASAVGVGVDEVNIGLQALIRTGRLRMVSATRWETRRDVA